MIKKEIIQKEIFIASNGERFDSLEEAELYESELVCYKNRFIIALAFPTTLSQFDETLYSPKFSMVDNNSDDGFIHYNFYDSNLKCKIQLRHESTDIDNNLSDFLEKIYYDIKDKTEKETLEYLKKYKIFEDLKSYEDYIKEFSNRIEEIIRIIVFHTSYQEMWLQENINASCQEFYTETNRKIQEHIEKIKEIYSSTKIEVQEMTFNSFKKHYKHIG